MKCLLPKEWTILIYANGNNEFEPEMYKALLDCKKVGFHENVNVLVELGRLKPEIVQLLRPECKLLFSRDNWTGVRRYSFENGTSILLKELGNRNMSDPENLYRFIKWGMQNYPARHYMLVLGGHGVSFVGMMTDLSLDKAYLMGTPEMCSAIDRIKHDMNASIDILVLDMCYMNTIEVIYELGKNRNHAVKVMITYIHEGPFSGMAQDKLIELVEKNYKKCTIDLAKEIIDEFALDLIAFKIDPERLIATKACFSELAYLYMKNKNIWPLPIEKLLSTENSPLSKKVEKLNEKLSSLIVHYKRVLNHKHSLINILSEPLGYMIFPYKKLAFSMNNYWTYLLADKPVENDTDIRVSSSIKPMIIANSTQSLLKNSKP